MEPLEQLTEGLRELADAFSRHSTWGFFHFAKENELSPAHMGVLMRLARGGHRGIARMGSELSMTGAAASQMIDRLVQQGLVERREDPADRRSKRIELTALGERRVRECREARERWLADLAARMSPEEIRTVAGALGILTARVKELEGPDPHRAWVLDNKESLTK